MTTKVNETHIIEWGARVSLELARRGWNLLWALPDKRILFEAIDVLVANGWRPPKPPEFRPGGGGYL